MLSLQERADAPSSFRVGLLADRLRDHSSQSRGSMLTKNPIGLLITLSALAAFVALGSSSVALGTSPSGAREIAEKWLHEKRAGLGFDPKSQSLIVVESASIAVPPTSPLYLSARQAAFSIAMQKARKSAAEFLAAEITAGITSKTTVQESFGEILGDPRLVAAINQATKDKYEATREVRDTVAVVANVSIIGLSPWQTFESTDTNGAGEIAVVAAMSPKYSAAICGDTVQKIGGEQTLQEWIEGLSDAELLSTLGTRFKSDERGALCVLAFGQARIRPERLMEDFAIEEAKQLASGALAFVHGQQIASATFRNALSQQTESSQLPPSFRSVQDFLSAVEANAALNGENGIEQIGRRTVLDPSSGEKVAVVVCRLKSVSNAGPTKNAAIKQVESRQSDCPTIPANMTNSTRQVFVKGTGATLSGAIASALMEAVRQEGTTVKGNSRLEKRFAEAMESVGQEVKDKIATSTKQDSVVQTFSNGFIYSYAKISESHEGDIFEVELCANLVRFDPKNPRFGLPPTVAVLPFSCGAEAAVAQGKLTTTTEKAIEKALVQSKQYQVIDAKNESKLQSIRDNAARLVLTGHAQEVEALKLGNELTADFVVIGSLIELKFTGQPGPLPQAIQASEIALATVEGKLINVASGEVIWVDTETIIMKGRDLLLVRASRDLQDPNEPNMSPVELVCTRAARALGKSLLAKVAPDAIPAIPDPVNAATALIRVVGKVLSIDASFPGVKVGAQFAIENPVEVSLPGGRKVLDHDRFGKIVISSIANGLAKATLVEGDSDLIHVGVSEIVLLKE